MRPIAAAFLPTNFAPVMSDAMSPRRPLSVIVSRDHRTYPSGSAINPGYAYGTYLPLVDRGSWLRRYWAPYTIPVTATRYNTVPMVWRNNVQWINPARAMRLKGLTTTVPGIDVSQIDAIQAYLGNSQG